MSTISTISETTCVDQSIAEKVQVADIANDKQVATSIRLTGHGCWRLYLGD